MVSVGQDVIGLEPLERECLRLCQISEVPGTSVENLAHQLPAHDTPAPVSAACRCRPCRLRSRCRCDRAAQHSPSGRPFLLVDMRTSSGSLVGEIKCSAAVFDASNHADSCAAIHAITSVRRYVTRFSPMTNDGGPSLPPCIHHQRRVDSDRPPSAATSRVATNGLLTGVGVRDIPASLVDALVPVAVRVRRVPPLMHTETAFVTGDIAKPAALPLL